MKKNWTRKKKMRFVCIGFAMILLLMMGTRTYLPTTGSAMRRYEHQLFVDERQVLDRFVEQKIQDGRLHLIYMASNGTVLTFSKVTFSVLLGWDEFGTAVLDLSGDWNLKAGVFSLRKDSKISTYVFGVVRDPEAAQLMVSGTYSKSETSFQVPVETFVDYNGMRCFYVSVPDDAEDLINAGYIMITAISRDGGELYQGTMEVYTSTSW